MPSTMNDLESARREYVIGRYNYCIKLCGYVLARDADDFDALQLIGSALLESRRLKEGVDALEHASLIKPLSTDSRISLAIAYGDMGRRQLSKDLLMAVATGETLDEDQYLHIAAGLEAIDEPRLAMEACRQAGAIAPDSAEVHYRMGYFTSVCAYPTSMTEALMRRAIELAPDHVHYRIGLVSLLVRMDRKAEALRLVHPMIPSHLGEVHCLCCLKRIANLFFDFEDLERARLCVERLQELRNDFSKERSPVR